MSKRNICHTFFEIFNTIIALAKDWYNDSMCQVLSLKTKTNKNRKNEAAKVLATILLNE